MVEEVDVLRALLEQPRQLIRGKGDQVRDSIKALCGATVVAAVCSALLSGPAKAQGGGDERIPRVSLRETAAILARSGAAHTDARTVLAAAQIMMTAEGQSVGLDRIDGAPGTAARPEEADKPSLTAAALLRLASRLAVEELDVATARMAARLAADTAFHTKDAALAPELARAAAALAGTRGAAGGPVWADGYLGTGEAATFRVRFEGTYAPNRVSVSASSGNGDLDCYLYEGDKLVARDAGYRGDCVIEWSQRFSGAITLRIRNTGAATYYVLASN